MGGKSASELRLDLITAKKAEAEKLAGNRGVLSKKQFASVAELSLSGISGVINAPEFPKFLKKDTPGGKGGVQIPLTAVIWYIEEKMYQVV